MRTTLTIDDDVLQAAKERAHRERTTAGAILSDLARRALTMPTPSLTGPRAAKAPKAILGFVPFPSRGNVVTNEHINKLRAEVGDG